MDALGSGVIGKGGRTKVWTLLRGAEGGGGGEDEPKKKILQQSTCTNDPHT